MRNPKGIRPPRPKSVYDYLSKETRKDMTEGALDLAKRTPVILDPKHFASGSYDHTTGTVTMRPQYKNKSRLGTHELTHKIDFNNNKALGEQLAKVITDADKQRAYDKYWGNKVTPPPLVVGTGSHYPKGMTSNRREERWRQYFEGQPPTEMLATIMQGGRNAVPGYLREFGVKIFKLPRKPR